MASVRSVKSWMSWYGWTRGGEPGSQKLNHRDWPIARHGDPVWEADVERAVVAVDNEREEQRRSDDRRLALLHT